MTQTKFIRVTDQKEIDECHENHRTLWGVGLSVEGYQGREQTFADQEINKNGSLKYWALKTRESEDQPWEIAASMESNDMKALMKQKGEPVKEIGCHTIMSVFTATAHRGNGYATEMLTSAVDAINELNLDGKGKNSPDFIALWSDIGTYYGKFGFVGTNDRQLTVKINSSAPKVEMPSGVLPIRQEDLPGYADRDIAMIKQVMDRDTEADGVARAVITPVADCFNASINRMEFVRKNIEWSKNKDMTKQIQGAEYNGSFIIWHHNWHKMQIEVLRMHVPLSKSKDEATADSKVLLEAMANEAAEFGMSACNVWSQDVPEQLSEDAFSALLNGQPLVVSATIEKRETSSLPMARFNEPYKNTKWIFEGKYAAY